MKQTTKVVIHVIRQQENMQQQTEHNVLPNNDKKGKQNFDKDLFVINVFTVQ